MTVIFSACRTQGVTSTIGSAADRASTAHSISRCLAEVALVAAPAAER